MSRDQIATRCSRATPGRDFASKCTLRTPSVLLFDFLLFGFCFSVFCFSVFCLLMATRRVSQKRVRVALDEEGADNPLDTQWRQHRLQPSRNKGYQSSRSAVVEEVGLPSEDPNLGLDADDEAFNDMLAADFDDIADEGEHPPRKAIKRSKASVRPMVLWKEGFRDIYLDEMLRLEGRGDAWADGEAVCTDCMARKVDPPAPGVYRCAECFLPALLCKECCLRRHRILPLHTIEEWTGTSFIKTTLKNLGLRLQLGHMSLRCSNPEPSHINFTILHTNGIHEVSVDFCACTRATSKVRQLLRRRLYPATQDTPRTCATFELLQQLHMLHLTSKCATYDFYRAVEKLTNNTGVNIPPSKYRSLLRMGIQWRHLKLMKRGGRGHDETGVNGTKEGELAVVCPSCPHPGINLPEDWEKAPVGVRFLYFVFLCMDANFRLKNQLVSNYSTDPGLGTGLAYMIKREPLEEYVQSRAKDLDEESTKGCGLQAVEQAHTRFNKGLRYTGVSAVSCGRSEMVMPCSIGNLKKGEKYANMDYGFGRVLQFLYVLWVLISYDAACHWFVNLYRRINTHWPEDIKPRDGVIIEPLIPKLHDAGHKKTKNHEQFSFNLFKGVGLTDGECPERIWAPHNPLGNSTKTMGPGSRHDVLDDHFGFWNYEKYISMGKTLMRRYKKALPERNRQVEAHCGFTASLDAADVEKWTAMCDAWESDSFPKSVPNPYEVKDSNITQAQAEQELEKEEMERRLLNQARVYHKTSACSFLTQGLELEESQHRILEMLKIDSNESVAEERAILWKKIEPWRHLQTVYMPGLIQYHHDREHLEPGSTMDSENPEEVSLWLPSALPAAVRELVCTTGLSSAEEKLRTAQCYDSLIGIRDTLRLKTRMVHFKNKNIRGQKHNTRSRSIIDRVHDKAKQSAWRYRDARKAKLALAGPGPWEQHLRILENKDIRSYQDPEHVKKRTGRKGIWEDDVEPRRLPVDGDDSDIDLMQEDRHKRDGTGQTHTTLSWIWTVEHHDSSSNGDDVLRSEWARSRARAERATEEVLLLREEMRRVLAFLNWKAKWWSSKQESRPTSDVVLAEGIRAYAVDQGSLQRKLQLSFQEIWKAPLQDMENINLHDNEDSDGDESDDDN
ncbi:hypothetical protein GALMADRAFT_1156932 [Galerina marginata CBS 339.88]|uniref:CxC2-like cysteine cluster KDZ transposase-associated domain-containing protein n=1 Tax=Galerina marginata (strain CBS 339.88) TaxID=685588 RepID=A0A067S645_GALM3|nr:hypothetical protein GALMADRAFT_1156932 [Galerina marginata CBS 339.88]